MLGYYLGLAMRSCRRSKALTVLVVVLMGFGVATCMVTYAVFRATSGNPIPWKSGQLFAPQVDNFGPVHNFQGKPPSLLSYTDAMALMHARQARRQTLVYAFKLSVMPDDARMQPFSLPGDAVSSDFFGMFDATFAHGGGWTASEDDRHDAVAVISGELNQKLFGGNDSVGHTIRLDAHDFRVVGVLDGWNPRPRYFDVANTARGFADPGQIYIPVNRAVDMQKASEYDWCSADATDPDIAGWDAYLHSECVWIGAWVELPIPSDVERYRQYLTNYASEQQRVGRFGWPANVRLSNVMQWMADQHVVPKESKLSMIVSVSFLLICLVNVVGLMLARFMRRAPEIGVRRALGASRGAIYQQFLVEAATIGLAGGLLGVLLTMAGMGGIGKVFESHIARLAHLDASLILLTLLAAVISTLIAALYPTWRAAQVQPAWQLKSNG
jgi:putative ABC transport system permease protein